MEMLIKKSDANALVSTIVLNTKISEIKKEIPHTSS